MAKFPSVMGTFTFLER